MSFGYVEGEVCGRGRCKGVLREHPVENCSCHIAPPCGRCTENRVYCPECDYQGSDDSVFNDYTVNRPPGSEAWKWFEPRPLDPNKLDWRSSSHSNSSMIKEGVYPIGMSRQEVENEVRGTFGGRFEHFGNGKFKYIAYTD